MVKPSISFYTLGCRLNQSETAVIQGTFNVDGFQVVDFNQPADIVVINTCTVTENGDADTRRLVHKVNRLNPKARIALIGCQAQVQKNRLTELSNVHWVIGNAKKMDLNHIIKDNANPRSPKIITPPIPRKSFTIPHPAIDQTRTRANIKIQDGCDFFCSFCEIPYARGRARSRQFPDIVKEANQLAEAGYKEIVITGINVGTYKNNKKNILDVVDALEQIDNLERVRISSIEPTTIPVSLIKKMASSKKLCRHLHIPLQSGSRKILKKMKRQYTPESFAKFIQTAKDIVPEICVGTDIIVGFPAETEIDFEQTVRFLKNYPIDYFHVFSYSQRHFAQSRKLKKAVPYSTIQKRSKILRNLSQRKRELFYQSLLNTQQMVLFEQKKEGVWTGFTDNYVRVNVKNKISLENQYRKVLFESTENGSINGRLIKKVE